MGRMSLFSRTADLPGLHGTLRDCTGSHRGFTRLRQGDIAVIDEPDVSRQTAQRLLGASPAIVVNLASFSTGTVPNFGPHLLLDADIVLIEDAGAEFGSKLRDGRKVRVTEEGKIYSGDRVIGAGTVLGHPRAEANFVESQQSLVDHMEAYFGNTIQFIHSESPLLIDGLGIPDSDTRISGRKVVVVSPAPGHRTQLKQLRNFLREYEPVLIGVDRAADSLLDLGYKPDLVVGNPANIGADALRSGARVVLPAEPDGHAVGLERIQDLGVGAMTFPAATDSATDLALLLAGYHGAELVVNVGAPLDLDAIFAREPGTAPVSLLTRTKLGPRLVDVSAVTSLYNVGGSRSVGWLWAVLGLLVALAALVVIIGLGGSDSFVNNLTEAWNSLALTVQGWFS